MDSKDAPRRKPRVLCVGPVPPPFNGMSVVTETLLTSSLAQEFELIHLDTSDRRSLSNVGKLDLRNCILALKHGFEFKWLLLVRNPDLVYVPIAQNSLGFLRDCLFLLPAIACRRPLVVHLHGSAFRDFYESAPALIRFLVTFTLARVRRGIVSSENLIRVFDGLIPLETIRAVQNGIRDPLTDDPSVDGGVESRSPDPVILFLGSLTEAKGIMVLGEAMLSVWKNHPTAKLVLCGEFRSSELKERFQRLIEESGVTERVEFAGAVSRLEKERRYREASVFVCPSKAPEGQPLVILEAMAHSLPVVASRVGAIPDTIEDEVTGYLAEPGDPVALAASLNTLLGDGKERISMGDAARRRFEETYTTGSWAERLSTVFEEALDLG